MKKYFYSILLFACASNLYPQNNTYNLTLGNQNGTLIAIGGGRYEGSIINEFRKLAGGDAANIIIIPTAQSDSNLLKDSSFHEIELRFKSYGFDKITILHTRDPEQANEDAFIQPIK